MAQRGFSYHEVKRTGPESEPEIPQFPYAIDNVSWARRHGYGTDLLSKAAPAPATVNPNLAYVKGLSPKKQRAWSTALVGSGKQLSVRLADGSRISTSSHGCVAQARRHLYKDLPGWFRAKKTVENIDGFVQRAVRDDRRYKAAVVAWAACMRKGGREVRDPGQLRRQYAEERRGENRKTARRLEITTAVAEAKCATSTSMARSTRTLDDEYRKKMRRTFHKEYETLSKLKRSALPRAEEVLRRR